jgi:curved DNA-binding protein CbpA
MGRAEALALLELAEGAGPEQIRAAHRRLMRQAHPDRGGDAERAARLNQARDLLLES